MGKQIKVEIAQAIKLDPEKNYLIALDRTAVSRRDAAELLEALRKEGITASVALMVNGDPKTAVKVIEETPKAP